MIERLWNKAEIEDGGRKPYPTTLTRRSIAALDAAEAMAELLQAMDVKGEIFPHERDALANYRKATQ